LAANPLTLYEGSVRVAMQSDKAHDNPSGKKSSRITPERYQEIRALFESALEVAPDRRSEWLKDACKGDSELYSKVEELLLADRLAGDTGNVPQISALPSDLPEFPNMEGKRIDNYQIIREIGRGGMGIVYLARRADDLFSKQVALKVLRPERRDQDLDRRFRRERDIIARLEHPNIARLLDGGTTKDGLPYSVMEYVEGRPINVYCDGERLNITERLKIFQTICAAVQYAHQNLVVHRDLKPSNILVSTDGTVKLLDFGIAKLIANDVQETQTDLSRGVQVMTPAYASPEQTTGQPIGTSSDVYSLGVILYELVTGRSPYRAKSQLLHEVIKAICEQATPRPSDVVLQQIAESGTFDNSNRPSPELLSEIREGKPAKLQRRLAGELDNIILMALRKEPDRRYNSVEQFSSDIDRHLSGLPIIAQKDTVRYRLGKFVKRHRFGVSSAVLLVLLMFLAIVGTTWQARLAQQERNRAEREAVRAKFQSERAELKTKEAEANRQRAEREAANAREQLRIAEERTREAKAKDQEAKLERDRSAKMEQQLASLLAEGYKDPARRQGLEAARKLLRIYGPSAISGVGGSPPGWSFTNPENYEVSLVKKEGGEGVIPLIRSRRPKTQGFAELMQSMDAAAYRGKRIQLSAILKSKDVELSGNVFARISGNKSEELFTRKSDPSLSGTREWNRYTIVFDVPENSSEIAIGLMLQGGGSIWADKFSFDVVDAGAQKARVETKASLNLGFEDLK